MADVYPVDGVWVAMDSDFLVDRDEACLALKTFGTEAVSRKSIPELIIFTKDRRYDVKGDVQNETTIRSIKEEDGGFRIAESLGKRKHRNLGWSSLNPLYKVWIPTAANLTPKRVGSACAPPSRVVAASSLM
jgi:hypothetical protein